MSDYEDDLRWRLETLKIALDDDKIRIASHLADDFAKSLGAVKYDARGEIDLDTVDSRIRSMSLMTAHMQNRSDSKAAISQSEISNLYFEFIEKNLGVFIKNATDKKRSINDLAWMASMDSALVESLAGQIPGFLEALQEFWEAVGDSSQYHLQDIEGSKAVYGGDLFPSYKNNIASTAGLYIDNIVLSDPFWHSRHIFEHQPDQKKVFYLIKHTLNLWQYRDLAITDLPIPIVSISPFRSSINEDEAKFLKQITEVDGLKHAGALFGRDFSGPDELFQFVEKLKTASQAVEQIDDIDRLLFDTAWDGSAEEQIERSLGSDWNDMGGEKHAGLMIAGQCFGRMGQATDILLKSRFLNGVPLIDAPTSWKYFNWKLEYNAAEDQSSSNDLHMLRALQNASASDEAWLGNIPPAALIEMRKEGAFAEIRQVLSDGVEELQLINPTNFFRTGDRVVDNIRAAFDAHSKEVASLKKKSIKFAGHDIGSMISAGAIDIASIVMGTPSFGAASFAANQLIDAPKLREIPERFRNLKDAHRNLRKSPMGLFFKHK